MALDRPAPVRCLGSDPAPVGRRRASPRTAIGTGRRRIRATRDACRHRRRRAAVGEVGSGGDGCLQRVATGVAGFIASGAALEGGSGPTGSRSEGLRHRQRAARSIRLRTPRLGLGHGGAGARRRIPVTIVGSTEHQHEEPHDDQRAPQCQHASQTPGLLLTRLHVRAGMHRRGRPRGICHRRGFANSRVGRRCRCGRASRFRRDPSGRFGLGPDGRRLVGRARRAARPLRRFSGGRRLLRRSTLANLLRDFPCRGPGPGACGIVQSVSGNPRGVLHALVSGHRSVLCRQASGLRLSSTRKCSGWTASGFDPSRTVAPPTCRVGVCLPGTDATTPSGRAHIAPGRRNGG